MILNDELNVSLLNDNEYVQTFISVFHLSTFKYNKSVDTNIYLQAHGVGLLVSKKKLSENIRLLSHYQTKAKPLLDKLKKS